MDNLKNVLKKFIVIHKKAIACAICGVIVLTVFCAVLTSCQGLINNNGENATMFVTDSFGGKK